MKMRVYLNGDPEIYHNYRRAVERAGGTLQFGGEPQGCDALLLPGGGDLEPWRYGQKNKGANHLDRQRDETEFGLLEQFVREEKTVFGICRGLQVINVYFGGTLIQDFYGHGAENGEDRLHLVHTTDPALQELCGETAVVNSAHHQAIERIGKGLQVIQRATDGIIEAICHESLPILALQWHPERLQTAVGKNVFDWFVKTGFFRK